MSQDDIVKLITLVGIPILMIIFGTVWRIWCYVSDKNTEIEIQRLQSLNSFTTSMVSEAIKKSSATTKEATESFAKLRESLQNSRYGIATIDSNTTIEQVSPPKEYCQCDYCGTFYNGFVSNCKNCGAQIKMPSEFYKRDYIIKMNYLKR